MNDQRLYQVLLAPHVSEKTAIAAEMQGRHTFRVLNNATKLEVRKAVETLFDVNVRSVQMVNVSGKTKRSFVLMKDRTSISWEWRASHGTR